MDIQAILRDFLYSGVFLSSRVPARNDGQRRWEVADANGKLIAHGDNEQAAIDAAIGTVMAGKWEPSSVAWFGVDA